MRQSKQKGSGTGRTFLIAIVVLTSAVSFILGYFVGKAGVKERNAEPQIIAMPSEQESVEQEQSPEKEEKTNINTIPYPSAKETKIVSEKTMKTASAKKETIPPKAKESKSVGSKKESAKAIPMYTVQAGAFKNIKDAETLKHKLEKKGYKAYIKKYTTANNTKLFKVRAGEFTNKKDAEAAAQNLSKFEGLNAFVILKHEGASKPHAKQEKIR